MSTNTDRIQKEQIEGYFSKKLFRDFPELKPEWEGGPSKILFLGTGYTNVTVTSGHDNCTLLIFLPHSTDALKAVNSVDKFHERVKVPGIPSSGITIIGSNGNDDTITIIYNGKTQELFQALQNAQLLGLSSADRSTGQDLKGLF